MAVQPQTPYIEHIANGVTTVFPLEFDCENKDHLIVLIDDVEADSLTWVLANKQVTFTTAPALNKKITFQRNTPYRRDRNYQTYDNSFRPDPVNKDFDWIWWKSQELGVADWLLNNKIQKFRDDVNLTALENTLEQAEAIRDETANSVIEVQSNVTQSQNLLTDTTTKANQAEASASIASSASIAAQQAQEQANAAEGNVYAALTTQTNTVNAALSGFTNGASKWYATLALANADITNITIKDKVDIGEIANGGTWYKATAGSVALTKSPYDAAEQGKNYTDVATVKLRENFNIGASKFQYQVTTKDGAVLFLIDANGDIVDPASSKNLTQLILESTDIINKQQFDSPVVIKTKSGQVIAYIDKDLNLYVGGGESIQSQIAVEHRANEMQDLALSYEDKFRIALGKLIVNLKSIAAKSKSSSVEGFTGVSGEIQRIPAIIKTSNENELLYFWGGGVAGYNGDAEGVKLYKRFVTYDADFNTTKTNKELFRGPTSANGVTKHPMLGRTKDNRIILMFDEKSSNTDIYRQYVCFSSDEGRTFTIPTLLPLHPTSDGQNVLGSTGSIVTMPDGRIVCPKYYYGAVTAVGTIYSDDSGSTWQHGALTNYTDINESAICLDYNNNLFMTARVEGQTKKLTLRSIDNGESFQIIGFNNDLPSSVCASSLCFDQENKLMLHGTPTTAGYVRKSFEMRVSANNGENFPFFKKIFPETMYIGYTHLISLGSNIYALATEGLSNTASINTDESVGIYIFNIKELF